MIDNKCTPCLWRDTSRTIVHVGLTRPLVGGIPYSERDYSVAHTIPFGKPGLLGAIWESLGVISGLSQEWLSVTALCMLCLL